MLLNYLQVLGIAIAITVHWSDLIYDMLRAAEIVGGVATSAASGSLDCLASDDATVPRSITRTIVGLCIPLMVICILSLFWLLVTLNLAQVFRYWLTRSLLAVVVVMYISYIGITETLIRIVYCVDVHDSFDPRLDDVVHSYWAMDTSLKCYEDRHLALVVVVAIPFLILFSIAFPVFYAVVVYRHKIKQVSKATWVPDTMAFMFRAYDDRFVFWESVILIRKALLSVVVVFSYPLGGTLQGTLAVAVLVVASYAHQMCRPFSTDFSELNDYEGLSLLMSTLTFICGFFFGDDRTSQLVRNFLAASLLLSNLGLFAFLCLMLMRQTVEFFEADLDLQGIPHSPKPWSVVSKYLVHYFDAFYEAIGISISQRRSRTRR